MIHVPIVSLAPVAHGLKLKVLPNTRPGSGRKRQAHCKRGHNLNDPASVYIDGTGGRHCKICRQIYYRLRCANAGYKQSSAPRDVRRQGGEIDIGDTQERRRRFRGGYPHGQGPSAEGGQETSETVRR